MTFRPNKPAEVATPDEIRRCAVISQEEIADPTPDSLCLLKRKVKQFDDLEVSNHGQWVTKVAAISNPRYRTMFQGGNMDRIRYRYAVYGWGKSTIDVVLTGLTAAFLA
jgi:hypothetical protein